MRALRGVLASALVMIGGGAYPGQTIELFNGRDLTGWYKFLQHRGKDNDPKNVISVRDGAIHVTGEEFGCLTTEDEYENYRLTVEYRFTGMRFAAKKDWALDSGILFHSVGKDGGFAGIWMYSHEMNLITGATGDFWTVHPSDGDMYLTAEVSPTRTLLDKNGKTKYPIWQKGGSATTITGNQRICRNDIDPAWTDTPNAPYAANEKPTGEWNTAVLECRGDTVDCYFNGKHVNHATHVWPARGKIQLQSEGCGVEFRRVTLERFDKPETLLADAEWITGSYVVPAEDDYAAFFRDAPAPELRRTFTLPAGPIRRASWKIAAPGMCDAYVNGTCVTPTALPLWTSYRLRVIADEYDIAALLKPGEENTLELRLGNGWWNLLPMKMWGRFNLRENLAQGTPCVKAELTVEPAQGATMTVATDTRWQAGEGPVLRNSLYLGEKRDLRRVTEFTAAARTVKGPQGRLELRGSTPRVVVYDNWPAIGVSEPKPGVYVIDFGKNFAGNLRARVKGMRGGEEVTFKYGELLHPDGTVNGLTTVAGQQKNAAITPPGIAYQQDTLVCRAGDQTFEPRFTFHGFRYCEVRGLAQRPCAADFMARAYSADVRDAGSFTCSNEKLNRVRTMARNTFRSNLQGVQSDCPARERFAYSGDLSVSAESFILNYDMHAFYRKVLRDRCDTAKLNLGMLFHTSPNVFPLGCSKDLQLGFSVDAPVLADLMIRYYGDLEIAAEIYPTLTRFLEVCARSFGPENVPPCIGDHEALEKADMQTTAICHYHQFLKLTAKIARHLGKANDAAHWEKTAGELERVFRDKARYVPAKGYVGNGRQGEECFAIYHGMFPADDEAAAYQLLRKDVIAHGYALSTGIFATQYLLEILTARGDAEIAGRVATHEGFPGWFHMLDRGATTLWETWAETDDIYSMNHPMFGSVAAWMMRGILGIQVAADAVGCDKVRIAPNAVAGITAAEGWYDTPKGRISVSWKMENGQMKVEKTVPAGITLVE